MSAFVVSTRPQEPCSTRLTQRRDVVVAPQKVVGVVAGFERLEAPECFIAECGSDSVERFVRLHVVGVAAPDRPGLDYGRGLSGPGDVLVVDSPVGPARHRTEVEGRVAITNGCGG